MTHAHPIPSNDMTEREDKPESLGSGNSCQTNHIDRVEVFSPNATTVVNRHTIVIRFSFHIQISGGFLERIFRALTEKTGLTWNTTRETHFDGESPSEITLYQLSGSPSDIVPALQRLREEVDETAIASVRYISKARHFDRNRLTLAQAIDIATYERRL